MLEREQEYDYTEGLKAKTLAWNDRVVYERDGILNEDEVELDNYIRPYNEDVLSNCKVVVCQLNVCICRPI